MNQLLSDAFGTVVSNDVMEVLLGDKLGEGSYRKVFSLTGDPTKVIKIEVGSQSFSNITEWDIWSNCPDRWKVWLAPCVRISPCGAALIQERVRPVKRLPVHIPDFLADLKLDNWGIYKGRVVCCDYGNHLFFHNGFRNAKIIKPDVPRD